MSRGLSGFRECRRLDDTTRQDEFSGGKCPRYHASQLFNLSPASSPLCFFFWARFLYVHSRARTRTHTHIYIYARAREPWHRAKHAKPAIKFLEHVPSCKYAVRVLVFETHFTYLVSSPACLEAVPLDRKWKCERYRSREIKIFIFARTICLRSKFQSGFLKWGFISFRRK